VNPIYYILIAVIVIVISIDFYSKRKKKLSANKDIVKDPIKKELNKPLVIIIASVMLSIASFFAVNHIIYEGKLTDTDDGVSILQNLTLEKISSNEIISSDSMWVSRSTMQKLSCIVVDSFGNYNGVIVDGYQQGLWQYFYANKNLKAKVNFINGNGSNISQSSNVPISGRNGFFYYWHENGQLEIEVYYKNGKKDGKFKSWHENGQLEIEVYYKNDLEEGNGKRWYENGQLQIEENFKNGKKDGKFKSWHENGQLKIEVHYKNGEADGVYKCWYENGQLFQKSYFKNGKLNGDHTQWNEYGAIEYNFVGKENEDGTINITKPKKKPSYKPTKKIITKINSDFSKTDYVILINKKLNDLVDTYYPKMDEWWYDGYGSTHYKYIYEVNIKLEKVNNELNLIIDNDVIHDIDRFEEYHSRNTIIIPLHRVKSIEYNWEEGRHEISMIGNDISVFYVGKLSDKPENVNKIPYLKDPITDVIENGTLGSIKYMDINLTTSSKYKLYEIYKDIKNLLNDYYNLEFDNNVPFKVMKN